MERLRWVLPLSLALMLGSPAVVAGPSKSVVQQTITEFNTAPRSVRPDHPLLPINYTEVDGRSYGYQLPRRFVRLAGQGEQFTIKKPRFKRQHVLLELLSTRNAKVNVTVWDNQELTQGFLDQVVPGVLRELFEFGTAPAGAPLTGNSHSQMVHLRGCNHLPDAASRVEFTSVQDAQAAGFRLCPACFPQEASFAIEGFGPLRNAMVEEARIYEVAFPPVDDPRAQASLQSIGESVVDEFPIEITDFDYTFKFVHSNYANARSYYSGLVYVTDALMAMIEEPAELEFVLAHEILHTARHQPAPPFYARGDVATIESQMDEYYRQVRFRETEADLVGLLWLNQRYGSVTAVQRGRGALAKLQFINEALPVEEEATYATHPSFSQRLELFDPERFQLNSDVARIFCGLNRDGETLVRVRALAKAKDLEATRVYLLVEATDLMNEPLKLQLGELQTADGSKIYIAFTGAAASTIPPSGIGVVEMTVGRLPDRWTVSRHVVSHPAYFDRLQLANLAKLELTNVKDLERWALCTE